MKRPLCLASPFLAMAALGFAACQNPAERLRPLPEDVFSLRDVEFLMAAPDYCVETFDFETGHTLGHEYRPGALGGDGVIGLGQWKPQAMLDVTRPHLFKPGEGAPVLPLEEKTFTDENGIERKALVLTGPLTPSEPRPDRRLFGIWTPDFEDGFAKTVKVGTETVLKLTRAGASFNALAILRAARFVASAPSGHIVYLEVDGDRRFASGVEELNGMRLGDVDVRVHQGLVALTSTQPFYDVEFGGTEVYIDNVCLFEDACAPSELAVLGARYLPGVASNTGTPFGTGVGYRFKGVSGEPRSLDSVWLYGVEPDPNATVQVSMTLGIVGQGPVLTLTEDVPPTHQGDLEFSFPGANLVDGEEYYIELTAPAGNGLGVMSHDGLKGSWLEPSLRFRVRGPYDPTDPASAALPLGVAIETSCP